MLGSWTSHQPASQPVLPSITPNKELCSSPVDGCQEDSFVISRVDYCKSAGRSSTLSTRPAAVCDEHSSTIVGAKKQDHIKHVLRDRFHWLPVPQRVQFKLCLLTYKALHGLALSYGTSPTSVDQSQPLVANGDSDPPLVATSLSPPLSRTLAPAHLLWRVLRPGINCRCTYEHRSWLVQDGTKVTFPLRRLITIV